MGVFAGRRRADRNGAGTGHDMEPARVHNTAAASVDAVVRCVHLDIARHAPIYVDDERQVFVAAREDLRYERGVAITGRDEVAVCRDELETRPGVTIVSCLAFYSQELRFFGRDPADIDLGRSG